jgi:hypothetical protein
MYFVAFCALFGATSSVLDRYAGHVVRAEDSQTVQSEFTTRVAHAGAGPHPNRQSGARRRANPQRSKTQRKQAGFG